MRLSLVPVLTMVMLIWGFNFVVAKWGMVEIRPMLLLAIRFLLVGAMLIPFVAWPGKKIWHVIGLSFVLGTLHFGLMFNGLTGVDAGVAAIAAQLQVPFAALLAAILFRDHLGWARAGGMVCAFTGVVLIAGAPNADIDLFYLGMVILASFMWAISTVQVKIMGEAPPFSVLAWSSLFTAPQLFVLSLIFEEGQLEQLATAGVSGWGAILYMALGVSVIGYGIWYTLLRRYDVNQMMPFTLLLPGIGVVSGAVFLGEVMTWLMWLGAALTVLGLAIMILTGPRNVGALRAVTDEAR